MLSKYEIVIGLEVHAQAKTKTKIFCGCSTKFGALPNTQICPVCTGYPGVLPVMNEEVVNLGIKACLMLDFEINKFNKMDRKNYFYPDLPKAYQISQFDKPIGINGKLKIIKENGEKKEIAITRVHMEEDAGKLTHTSDGSLVDFNRGGTPLLEIVSEPDLRSSEEAYLYLKKLKQILEYAEISDCNMEEGSLRCDANVSIREKGETELGVKTEIKNLNSFKFVQKAIDYEVQRQIAIIEDGDRVIQETRLFNPDTGKTKLMRSKEEAHDYRYFPDPDLVPIVITDEQIEEIKKTLPSTPDKKAELFQKEFNLPAYDALVLTKDLETASYFEKCCKGSTNYKVISNWMMGELIRDLNEKGIPIEASLVKPEQLSELVDLIDSGKISGKIAKDVFKEMAESGKNPSVIVKEKGLEVISDESELDNIIQKVLMDNEQSVNDFKSGKGKALGFLVGQVMKATKGKASPQVVNQLLKKALSL